MDIILPASYTDYDFLTMKGKKMLKKLLLAALVLVGLSVNAAAEDKVKKLPAPSTESEVSLMEAVNKRQSRREFSPKAVDDQTLSDILYVAWGISHDGKRTIPTSMNKQNMNVYAVMADGAWLYQAETNTLKQVSDKDLRPLMAKQDYVKDAPLVLVYTGTDEKNSPLHAGSAYQNVGLYAASRGLNNVVRGYFDKDGLAKALNVKSDDVIVTQVLGWPYM